MQSERIKQFRTACYYGDIELLKKIEKSFTLDDYYGIPWYDGFLSACSGGQLSIIEYISQSTNNLEVNDLNDGITHTTRGSREKIAIFLALKGGSISNYTKSLKLKDSISQLALNNIQNLGIHKDKVNKYNNIRKKGTLLLLDEHLSLIPVIANIIVEYTYF